MKSMLLGVSFVLGIIFIGVGIFFNPSVQDINDFFNQFDEPTAYKPDNFSDSYLAQFTQPQDEEACAKLAIVKYRLKDYLESYYHYEQPLIEQLSSSDFSLYGQAILASKFPEGRCETQRGYVPCRKFKWNEEVSLASSLKFYRKSSLGAARHQFCQVELKILSTPLFEYVTSPNLTSKQLEELAKESPRIELIKFENKVVDYRLKNFEEVIASVGRKSI